MEYFELPIPDGDGLCSDNQCPCADTIIPQGKGYLYVGQDAVDFRKDAKTVEELYLKVKRMAKQFKGRDLMVHQEYTIALLSCKKGALLRNLDLSVAGSDAAYWWKTGLAPLRATPLTPTSSERNQWWQFWKRRGGTDGG